MRAAIALALLLGCAPSPPSTELYAHPWPDERLRTDDGGVDVSSFPPGNGSALRRDSVRELNASARGFGLSSGIFFPFDVALDDVPSVEESVGDDATVFVMDVDPASDEQGARHPIDAHQQRDAGPFGGTELLTVLPYPGIPLAPERLYAAVVRVEAGPLSPIDGPRGREQASALDVLAQRGVPRDRIAALAVFRTDDPTREMRRAVEGLDPPPPIRDLRLVETYDAFCVYRGDVTMPVYQAGAPPYLEEGGWVWGEDGLVEQARMRSRLFVTVPRTRRDSFSAETGAYASAVFIRTGGGGDRPLIDRGVRDETGEDVPGTGFANELAAAGYVGVQVDGPLGGVRNLAAWDEQLAIFDPANPVALRDNVRQSALELVMVARALEALTIDATGCDGASEVVTVDPRPVLIGHSMGATIAPLAMAFEPRFRALIMSGAGASWIRQVVHKMSPFELRQAADVLAGYWPYRTLNEHDPLLSLVQWAGEPAEPLVFMPYLRDRPVLVFQGILDTYIPPPISNPVALALGLDLAGPARDEALDGYRDLEDDLALIGGRRLDLPVAGNQGDGLTRVLVQHDEDGIEDGHEVMYQRAEARRQVQGFLETLARDGVAEVPAE